MTISVEIKNTHDTLAVAIDNVDIGTDPETGEAVEFPSPGGFLEPGEARTFDLWNTRNLRLREVEVATGRETRT